MTAVLRPDPADVIDLLSSLVAINSINPSLVPGAPGEKDIALFVAAWLRRAGLTVETRDVIDDRPNVIGRVKGRASGPALLLNAHLDTVSVTGMKAPFEARVEGDRLYGRGAFDMKGGLAAIMLAARTVLQSGGAAGDLLVTAVMDEEYASLGTQAVLESIEADAAIVTEPTGLRLCAAHKGFAWIALETQGKAAHGSRPDLGVDAVAHMGRALAELESLQAELTARAPHSLLGCGSIHASLIEGGRELSSYPDHCRLQVERRTLPGESREAVLAEIDARLEILRARDETFRARSELFFWRDPFEVAPEERIVQLVRSACAHATGSIPAIYGDTPWMDAAFLSGAGIPTVVFGPGGAGAHAAIEYGVISDITVCAEVLARVALAL